jgi:cytoskeletal protein RodZ
MFAPNFKIKKMKLTKTHKIIIGVLGVTTLAFLTRKYWMPKKKVETLDDKKDGNVSAQTTPTATTPTATTPTATTPTTPTTPTATTPTTATQSVPKTPVNPTRVAPTGRPMINPTRIAPTGRPMREFVNVDKYSSPQNFRSVQTMS